MGTYNTTLRILLEKPLEMSLWEKTGEILTEYLKNNIDN
jgi:hypothetical protein